MQAYSDEPLRRNSLHLSAPHIYGVALEHLDLPPSKPLSFLNVGSGTGYISTIVGSILGPQSLSHGIEIDAANVEFSRAAIANFAQLNPSLIPEITIVQGNALHLPAHLTLNLCYDRIYLGAAITLVDLPKIARLLAVGGILVGPVDDELRKITRVWSAEEVSGQASAHEDIRVLFILSAVTPR